MTSLRLSLLAPLVLVPTLLPAVSKAGPLTVQRGPYSVGSARPVPIPTCWDAILLPMSNSRTGNGAKVPCQARKVNTGR